MRDPKRIKQILAELEECWMQDPDSRLCQLIYNLAYHLTPSRNGDIFYVEDDKMLAALQENNEYDPAAHTKPLIDAAGYSKGPISDGGMDPR